ncbi:hypothetical protein pb186bvf_015798 [Paramecium bursaria]
MSCLFLREIKQIIIIYLYKKIIVSIKQHNQLIIIQNICYHLLYNQTKEAFERINKKHEERERRQYQNGEILDRKTIG